MVYNPMSKQHENVCDKRLKVRKTKIWNKEIVGLGQTC